MVVDATQREYCKRCKKWFGDWDAFTVHKIQSKAHIACHVCGRDFQTQLGCTRHEQQDHAAEQELFCAGCHMKFTRVGAYISHIEQRMCKVIHKDDFDRQREEKKNWHKATKPGKLSTPHSDIDDSASFYDNSTNWEAWPTQTGPSFDTVIGLTALGDTPTMGDFPALPITDYKNGGSKVPDFLTGTPDDADLSKFLWNNNQNTGRLLFPYSTHEGSSSTEVFVASSVKIPDIKPDEAKEEVYVHFEYDPDNPAFDPYKYYNPYSKKFRCAWPGCRKMQSHVTGLVQHLKSPAHMDEKLRCPGCLRQYNSATALVQHAEAQAVKCEIRHTSQYRQAVDLITGGLVDTMGKHADGTIRYVAPQEIAMSNIRRTNRALFDQQEQEQKDCIKQHDENVKW